MAGDINQETGIDPRLLPKPGFLTSSFWLWLATFVGGGLISYLVRRGLPQDVAEANRSLLVTALNDGLPLLWLAVSAWLGRAYIAARRVVSTAKAEALIEIVKAQPGGIKAGLNEHKRA